MKIILGDCIEQMKQLTDKSIDLILTDLPYEMLAPKWDVKIDLVELWEQYNRICKGNVLLFATQPFTTDLIYSNRKNFKYTWYWLKNQGTNFFHAKSMPIRKVEEILVFNKGIYNPQFTDGHLPTNSAKGCSNGNAYHGKSKRDYVGGSTVRYPNNILEYKCVDNYSRLHTSQKPVDLLEYLIKTYSNEGNIVLDCCAGSFSTGIACLNTNRNFIGIEKDESYFNIGYERLIAHHSKPVIEKM